MKQLSVFSQRQKISHRKTGAIIITLSLLFPLLITACITAMPNVPESERIIKRGNTDKLVVLFSLTENTAKMGKAISEKLNTDYVRLIDPVRKKISMASPPRRNQSVSYTPNKINLSKYSLIFIGSPIWYYRPTAYAYSFIKTHNLGGKNVVLFYTYGGGLSGKAVPEWKNLVKKAGGTVIDVVGIDATELEEKTMESAANEIIQKRRGKWTHRKRGK